MGTISSAVYSKKINNKAPDIKVIEIATALLAPMIEEGIVNCELSKIIIKEYLSRKNFDKIQALILACTHYPIIKKEIENYYNNSLEVIDSASIVANATKSVLEKLKLINDSSKPKIHHFFVSDYTPFFEKTTLMFFKEKIHLELLPIWDNI